MERLFNDPSTLRAVVVPLGNSSGLSCLSWDTAWGIPWHNHGSRGNPAIFSLQPMEKDLEGTQKYIVQMCLLARYKIPLVLPILPFLILSSLIENKMREHREVPAPWNDRALGKSSRSCSGRSFPFKFLCVLIWADP